MDNVCVFGFAHKTKPIAIVIPDERALRGLVEKNNLGNRNEDLQALVKIKGVQDAVLKDILKAGKAAGLQGIQLVSGIVLTNDSWTPDTVRILEYNAENRGSSPQQ